VSEFKDAVAAAAQDTPYAVVATKKGFDVQLDIVNAQWWELFERAGLSESFRWKVREHRNYFTITDKQVNVKWSTSGPRFAMSWQMQGGRIFSYTRQKIWALSDAGRIEPVVNYKFNPKEGRDLIRLVARQLGRKERPPLSVNIGLAFALATPAFFAVYGLVQLVLGTIGGQH
jgi:hypothetical protein